MMWPECGALGAKDYVQTAGLVHTWLGVTVRVTVSGHDHLEHRGLGVLTRGAADDPANQIPFFVAAQQEPAFELRRATFTRGHHSVLCGRPVLIICHGDEKALVMR